jgi:hypothetical protein
MNELFTTSLIAENGGGPGVKLEKAPKWASSDALCSLKQLEHGRCPNALLGKLGIKKLMRRFRSNPSPDFLYDALKRW